jgi:hypothetical protein
MHMSPAEKKLMLKMSGSKMATSPMTGGKMDGKMKGAKGDKMGGKMKDGKM